MESSGKEARGLGGRYGLPCDGVLTWGQDFYGLNLLVPKEEASEICHQLARRRAEGTELSEAKHQQGRHVVRADAITWASSKSLSLSM